ncbi:hypothetical protein AAG570_010812 [Ranatra chinensis]|uniref:Reverse transcriptase RNase H-like domain-containing protein n=1 Tax=Ranatra chinensis TaxID=642074 RepID=A0ABD0YKW9_9HEMI
MERWNHLTKKEVKFEITDDMLKSLDWAIEHLCREPVLQFPDFTKQFVVTTDASQASLGAVLSQLDHLRDRPVVFVSRKLTSAESRYSAIERELLGVVRAVEYFRSYLWGRQFFIKTDHKLLVWVGGLKETSARVARWKEGLSAYSFTISHNKDVEIPLLESSIIPGLDMLRRRVVEELGLPTGQVPASQETPSRSPEPDRRNSERRVMTWLSDTLDDKARNSLLPSRDTAPFKENCQVWCGRWSISGPKETPQMVTPTPEKPLEVVEAYLVFLDGAIQLTLID